MDQVKIGKFIHALRKKNNLTQSEFANKLNVTSQAVSKWENGRGIPDIELLKKISEEFKVDISEILNGELKFKNKKTFLLLSICSLALIGFAILFIYFNQHDYHFRSLSSNNTDFVVNGIAAYSSDRKSIYISKIEYLGNDKFEEKYSILECALYEKHNNVETKIASCIEISNQEEEKLKSFKEIFDQIEFKIDNYDSTCKEITTDSLYIFIDAIDINKKSIIYKIPLKIDDKCSY